MPAEIAPEADHRTDPLMANMNPEEPLDLDLSVLPDMDLNLAAPTSAQDNLDLLELSESLASLASPSSEKTTMSADGLDFVLDDLELPLDLELPAASEPATSTPNDESLDLLFGPDEPLPSFDLGVVDTEFHEATPLGDIPLSLDLDFTLDGQPAVAASASTSGSDSADGTLPVYKNVVAQLTEAHFHPGEQVYHTRYGQGVIKRVITMDGDQVILNINFEGIGKRLLDPNLTKLEKVS
jgi:hypothetical protein